VLWVLGASAAPLWPAEQSERLRVVVNKVDLPPAWELEQASEALRVSARTGAGIAELASALARWLVPESPPVGAAMPFTDALADGVAEAQWHVEAGRLREAAAALRGLRDGQWGS
jgi:hypothetical protein